ncbi:MAG: acyl-protein synthetase [Deltaproteobacteria bacterium]|nr:acyl-protein synthetase [Deltaproteobacteria bacterium]
MSARAELWARARALILRLSTGDRDDEARDELLRDLARYQAQHVECYGRVVAARGEEAALPTDVFRYARVCSRPEAEIVATFRTSGTTYGVRGEHAFADLELYELAAHASARRALFPDVERMPLVMLAPRAEEAPDSSLTHMLERFAVDFGSRTSWLFAQGTLDLAGLREALRDADEPVAILGTSFALMQAMESLGERFELPAGSRIMQTGGFKGRSRALDPVSMRERLSTLFGVAESHIVAEYGMTELSSQAWEMTLRQALAAEATVTRSLRFPGWVRARVVDAVSLEPTTGVGVLRVDDVANVDSVSCILTSDLARSVGEGFELLGRAAEAVPRGCSLSTEEALDA